MVAGPFPLLTCSPSCIVVHMDYGYEYGVCPRCGYVHNIDDPYTHPNYDEE